jgi:hypothetical protein
MPVCAIIQRTALIACALIVVGMVPTAVIALNAQTEAAGVHEIGKCDAIGGSGMAARTLRVNNYNSET